MFTTKPELYKQNMTRSRALTFQPAVLTDDTTAHAAVSLHEHGKIRCVIGRDDAIRLANEIIEALAFHNTKNKEA